MDVLAVVEAVRCHAVERPDAVAVRTGREALSYAELGVAAHSFAAVLSAAGIRTLALALDNSVRWVVADLAAQIAGITVVPLPFFFSAEQIRHVIADGAVDAVAVDALGRARLAHLELRYAEDIDDGASLWHIGVGRGAPRPGATAKISYTSGTTGRPKGVRLSQAAMARVARSLCAVTNRAGIDSHLCLLPLATLLENIGGVYAPLLKGAEIVLPSLRDTGLFGGAGLDVERLLACMHAYRAESVILLPQMLAGLVEAAERGRPPPASLRFAAVGGGRVAASLLERADRLCLPVYEGYGLTECASVVALNTPAARRRGSVGRPLPHARVRIDADSQVLVGGATMTGYVGDPETEPRWIATGDLGHIDADGYLWIDGRIKSTFITSFGRNVSPDWVEAELTAGGAIAQAAVFGEARPWNVAVVVPAPGREAHEVQSDIDAANAALPDYARVHEWICAAEPFTPANGLATANGRNRRAAIDACYRARIDACYERDIGQRA